MKRYVVIIVAIALAFSLFGLYISTFVVAEGESAIVTSFGRPIRIVTEAGLYAKVPVHTVNRLDKRVQIFTTQAIQLLLGDRNPLILTTYVCWRVSEPLMYFQSVRTLENAIQKIGDLVNSQLGAVLGDHTIDDIINTDLKAVKLAEIEQKMFENANEKTKSRYGIEVVSVGIRRINYPDTVAEAVYDRMRSEREKEARKFRAEGEEKAAEIEADTDKNVSEIVAAAHKESEIIRGAADKTSMGLYAKAHSKDPEFFEFQKSLEAYKEILKQQTTLILSTDSELFKYLSQKRKQ